MTNPQTTNLPTLRIVRLGSLAEFAAEVAPGNRIRLHLTERWLHITGGLPQKSVELHLQGLNPEGELVWLVEGHILDWLPLEDQPFGGIERSIYQNMIKLEALVRGHLAAHGYRVLSGSYGLPRDVEPVNGHFEIAKWTKNDDGAYTLTVLDQPQPEDLPHAA
jgi:hypothetical protein